MPTPDTAMLAQLQALRARSPKLSPKEQEMRRIYSEVNQGTVDTLRSYLNPGQYLSDTLQGTKELLQHPLETANTTIQVLKDPTSRNRMIGSMLVPDPLSIVRGLRKPKLVKSDIVVPETLALPEERIEIALAKRGAPSHETGWFEGPDKILRKELEPIQFDIPEGLENLPVGETYLPPDFWSHPTLARRLKEKGMFGDDWNPTVRIYDPEELNTAKGGAFYQLSNEIEVGRAFRKGMSEKERRELLTHEFQHAIQSAGMLPEKSRGSSPGFGISQRRYLLSPGEIEARASAARDYLLDPRYKDVVPFDWNTKKMAERLRFGGNKPKMEGPKQFLEDMEQWLNITEPDYAVRK